MQSKLDSPHAQALVPFSLATGELGTFSYMINLHNLCMGKDCSKGGCTFLSLASDIVSALSLRYKQALKSS